MVNFTTFHDFSDIGFMIFAFTLLDFWSLRHPEAHALRHTMLGTKGFFVSFFFFFLFRFVLLGYSHFKKRQLFKVTSRPMFEVCHTFVVSLGVFSEC